MERNIVAKLDNALIKGPAAMQARKWEEALNWYEVAVGATTMLEQMAGKLLDPFAKASMLLGSAAALLRLGRDDEAEQSFKRAIEVISSSRNSQRVSTWQAFEEETRSALQGDKAALAKVKAKASSLRPLAMREGEAEVMVFYAEAIIERMQ